MSFVAINALTVSEPMRLTLEERFAARAGEVERSEGFEHFELLRPESGTDQYLVYTRWATKEHFDAWLASAEFGRGHAQTSADGPAASGSDVWTFSVAQVQSRP